MSQPKRKQTTSKKVKVIGTKEYIDRETGEPETMQVVSLEDRDFNFTKIWIGHIVSALEAVGNQKIKVITFLMENMTNDNYIIYTQRQIAKKADVSLQTVSKTMKALQEANIIRKKGGAYMFNPNCVFKGSHQKRMNVLLQYNTFDDEETETETEASKKAKEHGFDIIEGGKKESS